MILIDIIAILPEGKVRVLRRTDPRGWVADAFQCGRLEQIDLNADDPILKGIEIEPTRRAIGA